MVQRRIELINGVRTERVAYLGPIKSDPHDRGVISPVIGDVGEVKAIHRMPQLRRERASHALKLTVTRFERRSRAADDRRNDEQRARKLSNPASTVARCEERRRRQLPARRAREAPKKLEGAGHPATPRGPPIDQHPPRSTPLTRPSQRREIDWIPPTAGLSPSDPPHIS